MNIFTTEDTPFIRTDFTCDKSWKRLLNKTRDCGEDFSFEMNIIDDIKFNNISTEEIFRLVSPDSHHYGFALADKLSMQENVGTVMIVNLVERERAFRSGASLLASVDNNLSIGNMDFEDFIECCDDEGVFHGFSDIEEVDQTVILEEHLFKNVKNYLSMESPHRGPIYAGIAVTLGSLSSYREVTEEEVIKYLGTPNLAKTQFPNGLVSMLYFYTPPGGEVDAHVLDLSFDFLRKDLLKGVSFGISKCLPEFYSKALELDK